ncbi:MAG: outer membrane beta-barrel protein [Chlorobi bacterium]|nr:outer membrane beta-barrel protein [Chlorobiota bacterium]
MKNLILLFLSIVSLNLFAQEQTNSGAFSQFRFFANGGVNFNSVPTIGGSVFIGTKTNLSSNFKLNFSVGYVSIYDDDSYQVKTYEKGEIDGNEFYITRDVNVENVEYSTVPFSLGIEYVFSSETLAPFFSLEAGYSVNTVEEQLGKGAVRSYHSLDDVPDEYKAPRKELNTAPFFLIGVGAGFEYQISKSFGLSFKYAFNYNDGIPNTNQFLVGVIF